MCAVCVVVGAASYAALFTLSSGAHTFLDLVSLVFEEKKNSTCSATVLLLIIGMLFFCTIADKICSRSQVVRRLARGMSAKRFSAETSAKRLLGVRLFFQTQL